MKFKFYKVTSGAFIERVANVITARQKASKQILELVKELGAEHAYENEHGGISAFSFKSTPDKKAWKKANGGYMPKFSTKEGKSIVSKMSLISKFEPVQSALDVFSLEGLMVIGESTGRGCRMHEASFCGQNNNKTYFVKVPQCKEQPYTPTSNDLVECKEWEMLKFMED